MNQGFAPGALVLTQRRSRINRTPGKQRRFDVGAHVSSTSLRQALARADRVARVFDLAGITNTVGMVHTKIVKGKPPALNRT